jgi:hypothetical protein
MNHDLFERIIFPANSFMIFAATDAVKKSISLSGLYSTISAPTIRPVWCVEEIMSLSGI